MIERNSEIQTLEYRMTGKERIDGKIIEKTAYFKINLNPYKVFFTQKILGIDVEGRFEPAKNKKVAIKTKGFPWISANFDPLDNLLRNNHHHTLYEAGFGYIVDLIKHFLERDNNLLTKEICFQGIENKNGKDFYKIVLDIESFHYLKYTVQRGENLSTIAKKYMISDFMILEKNKEIKDYNDIKEGQQIVIPSDFAKKMVVYIDKSLYLPSDIIIYDDQGLFAEYIFYNIATNPIVTSKEFQKTKSSKNRK